MGFDHKGVVGAMLGVFKVGPGEMFEVGDDQAEDASGLEIAEDIAEGPAAIFE